MYVLPLDTKIMTNTFSTAWFNTKFIVQGAMFEKKS